MKKNCTYCVAPPLICYAFLIKFEDVPNFIPGSLLNIEDALTGSVKMTAPFDRRNGRHVLGKVVILKNMIICFCKNVFKGKEVEICIEGTLDPQSGVPVPFNGLKNSAHGKVCIDSKIVTKLI